MKATSFRFLLWVAVVSPCEGFFSNSFLIKSTGIVPGSGISWNETDPDVVVKKRAMRKIRRQNACAKQDEGLACGTQVLHAMCLEAEVAMTKKLAMVKYGNATASNISTVGSQATTPRARMAVLIVGLASRLMLESKAHRLLDMAQESSIFIDFYVRLVLGDASIEQNYSPMPASRVASPECTPAGLATYLSTRLQSPWTRLAHFDSLAQQEQVAIQSNNRRLKQYPPAAGDFAGVNALRRLHRLEYLMKKVVEVETASKTTYDYVLVTKDDDYWLGPLHMSFALQDPESSSKLYTKGCLTWGGINDKTLLFGSRAAHDVLTKIYTNFWEADPALDTHNSESFWNSFATKYGAKITPVPPETLPTVDSVFIEENGTPVACNKRRNLCPAAYEENPHLCPPYDETKRWEKKMNKNHDKRC